MTIVREERIGTQRLILGDCLEVMPTLGRFDAVVTDPPYGLGDWNNRGSNAKRPFDSDRTQAWDKPIGQEHIDALMASAPKQIIWGGNYLIDFLRSTKQMLVWNKGIRGMHFNDCEMAWCSQFREASRVFDYSPASAEPKQHPTQKPVALMEWCLGFLPDAKTILDPFMGSGTTLVACQRMGRQGIGIEIDKDYWEIACRRVDEAARQPDLLIPATRQAPTQEAMDL